MMRSLFSGVSGLKTHQTRMDVIGNNIANVNTTAYKSQSMVFSDLLYQTTQAASGANAATGRGGINARQIGLGAKTAAISTAISRQGSAQSTNNPWDVMITGESFFIVSSGSQNFFTRDGSFTIDGAGNLVMASTGYRVMGWQVDEETGEIRADVVSALQIMNRDNMTAPAEATTLGYASGILDKNDTDLHSSGGKVMTLPFYDALGYKYTAKMSVHAMSQDGNYYVQLDDIINEDGISLKKYYNLNDIGQIANFGGEQEPITDTKVYSLPNDGSVVYNPAANGNDASFTVRYSFDEILNGFSDNPMMSLAGDSVVVTNIAGVAPWPPTAVVDPVATGTAVTVEGNVTLTKSILQSEYGLAYDEKEGQYYYKDDNGATVALGPFTAPDGTININTAAWETVLGKLGGTVNLAMEADGTTPKISVDEKGDATLSFTANFTTNKASVYTPNQSGGGSFGVTLVDNPDNRPEILEKVYGLFGTDTMAYTINFITPDGHASITSEESYNGNMLVFDTKTGKFEYIGTTDQNSATLSFNASATDLTGATVDLGHFSDISIDFSSLLNINHGGVSTAGLDNGDGGSDNLGSGRKQGELIGVEIGQDGKIRASYDNGMTKLLGQIAVAKFANPEGLAKAGNNLYSTTMNSGEFDGVGIDITSDGEGSMESGVLEMSNVDLAGEFTEMITTQRGFQANSRIITTSDSMLEELVNLKR